MFTQHEKLTGVHPFLIKLGDSAYARAACKMPLISMLSESSTSTSASAHMQEDEKEEGDGGGVKVLQTMPDKLRTALVQSLVVSLGADLEAFCADLLQEVLSFMTTPGIYMIHPSFDWKLFTRDLLRHATSPNGDRDEIINTASCIMSSPNHLSVYTQSLTAMKGAKIGSIVDTPTPLKVLGMLERITRYHALFPGTTSLEDLLDTAALICPLQLSLALPTTTSLATTTSSSSSSSNGNGNGNGNGGGGGEGGGGMGFNTSIQQLPTAIAAKTTVVYYQIACTSGVVLDRLVRLVCSLRTLATHELGVATVFEALSDPDEEFLPSDFCAPVDPSTGIEVNTESAAAFAASRDATQSNIQEHAAYTFNTLKQFVLANTDSGSRECADHGMGLLMLDSYVNGICMTVVNAAMRALLLVTNSALNQQNIHAGHMEELELSQALDTTSTSQEPNSLTEAGNGQGTNMGGDLMTSTPDIDPNLF